MYINNAAGKARDTLFQKAKVSLLLMRDQILLDFRGLKACWFLDFYLGLNLFWGFGICFFPVEFHRIPLEFSDLDDNSLKK